MSRPNKNGYYQWQYVGNTKGISQNAIWKVALEQVPSVEYQVHTYY